MNGGRPGNRTRRTGFEARCETPEASHFRFGTVLHRVLERIHRLAQEGRRVAPDEA